MKSSLAVVATIMAVAALLLAAPLSDAIKQEHNLPVPAQARNDLSQHERLDLYARAFDAEVETFISGVKNLDDVASDSTHTEPGLDFGGAGTRVPRVKAEASTSAGFVAQAKGKAVQKNEWDLSQASMREDKGASSPYYPQQHSSYPRTGSVAQTRVQEWLDAQEHLLNPLAVEKALDRLAKEHSLDRPDATPHSSNVHFGSSSKGKRAKNKTRSVASYKNSGAHRRPTADQQAASRAAERDRLAAIESMQATERAHVADLTRHRQEQEAKSRADRAADDYVKLEAELRANQSRDPDVIRRLKNKLKQQSDEFDEAHRRLFQLSAQKPKGAQHR